MSMPPPGALLGGPASRPPHNLRKQALQQHAAMQQLGVFSLVAEEPTEDLVHGDEEMNDVDASTCSSDAWRDYWDEEIKVDVPNRYRVIAPDLRGHGKTTTGSDLDLDKQTLAEDIVALWSVLSSTEAEKAPVVLLGHSMGGAVAVWAAATRQMAGLEGLVVVDVVEGTAISALPHMMGIIGSRPTSFASAGEAVAWALRSGMSKNRVAAALSIPSQLVEQDGSLTWRTPLASSQPHWHGWYSGLSEEFLKLSAPKMLLLAGTDRLDRTLTIGQMQGKFQMVVLPAAGHAVHEDEPDKTADNLLQFLRRFRIGEPPMQFPKAAGIRPVLPVAAGSLPGNAGEHSEMQQ